ncbi:OLC1v1006364C1 [Oldenlandia corymbosa var. corymbosa]|uniref:OLC1v1006364C1 n=1 Tax=Oldenlandia corymbosa var. corymbosa TaxID=529605 RepID=A0AAV1DK59_OLDCO|nr:OLC1v1006364C1 [Oldenlandia corymbosa var. corymbosa]
MAPFRMIFWILLGVHFCISLNCIECSGQRTPKFPAILVFGDSAFDTGNNNYITTVFKANYFPYGLNYPGRVSTGRYSDGKLIPDLLASSFGIKEAVPPFLQPNLSDQELLTGVCFASAGSGLDDQTTVLSNSIPMSKQPDLFRKYLDRLNEIVKPEEAQRIVREALVVIHAGTVDFMYNFYILRSFRMVQFSLRNMQEIYDLGCRHIVVCGLPPMGCMPLLKSAQFHPFSRTCLENVNSVAQSYNGKLKNLLQEAHSELPGSKILYADTYNPLLHMIQNPTRYGFKETARGCCGTGTFEGNQLCNIFTPICSNPSQHIWWDSMHPTEAVYRHLNHQFIPPLHMLISASE